ncbi:MAG: biotin--[acetyl-CoA-carboxylase] ligase [Ruminococcaceae bacterium]|nr:biotin--[acetyl-CoA-carboxylase] ligase [Oscillospiraceae bacterium]
MTTEQHLAERGIHHIILIEKENTGSTNTDAKQYIEAASPENPVLITAETQTGGRGRQGKQFSSPKGGLYMTLAVKHDSAFADAVRITAAAAVAVSRAIRSVCDLSCEIKWVNDIYAGGKKLCGILTEAVNDYEKGITEYLIIGVGVNISEFPEGINATSLFAELGKIIDKNTLCAEITAELLTLLCAIKKGDFSYMDDYRRLSCVIGKDIVCFQNGEAFTARATGIDDDGGLLVTYSDGRCGTLSSGEITLRFADMP